MFLLYYIHIVLRYVRLEGLASAKVTVLFFCAVTHSRLSGMYLHTTYNNNVSINVFTVGIGFNISMGLKMEVVYFLPNRW
jgi:hypothetical protein